MRRIVVICTFIDNCHRTLVPYAEWNSLMEIAYRSTNRSQIRGEQQRGWDGEDRTVCWGGVRRDY